jgi:hypothetical protein
MGWDGMKWDEMRYDDIVIAREHVRELTELVASSKRLEIRMDCTIVFCFWFSCSSLLPLNASIRCKALTIGTYTLERHPLILSRANDTRRHELLDLGPHARVLEVVVQGCWVGLRLVEDALHDRVWCVDSEVSKHL